MESAEIQELLGKVAPAGAEFCSLRYVDERDELLSVRQDVPTPPLRSRDVGAMVTVVAGGGLGYAATSELTERGLRRAAEAATGWAKAAAGRCVADFSGVDWPHPTGEYVGPAEQPWDRTGLDEKYDLLREQSSRLKAEDRVVDWEASLWHTGVESLYLTTGGGVVRQQFSFVVPGLRATANEGAETQTRTLAGLRAKSCQGGMEVLDDVGFRDAAPTIAAEAVELLSAPNCPTGTMGVVLGADQMILQVHESVGHPLELDRILGDERNYAGTSFVTLDMFGSYRYGSEHMNVTFDPTRPRQFASYGWDDDGLKAERAFLIRDGILQRPLGGICSQARAGIPGVGCARANGWNRPPIDRMANLNLEPGEAALDGLIARVERGVFMRSNGSWSIDDSRNKFQFGCEWARLIEDGELTGLVKNPNYRGISATFWRSLQAVGDESTFEVMGTPYCGKGEPNQIMRVGHACPAALFGDVEVFGGA